MPVKESVIFDDEKEIKAWTVSNENISFSAMELGCAITNLFVPDKKGNAVDVLLGFDSYEEWKAGTQAHNAIVGRFANRIKNASFTLNGKTYTLDKNDGENCLHGGFVRYEKQIWHGEPFEDDEKLGIVFTRTSPDGEQNFPGCLKIKVVYSLSKSPKEKGSLYLEYFAGTDKDTIVNLTNHAYFNLNGSGDVFNHTVCLDCDKVLEVNDMIPTGNFLDLSMPENKAFDFRNPKKVGDDFPAKGYDHCYVTKAEEKNAVKIGYCTGNESKIKMRIYTNQRGIQFYTGNYLSGEGKGGNEQTPQSGLCFEAQRFPDCINHGGFPSCVLHQGETYHQKTIYKFSV